MPKEAERQVKRQGGVARYRTLKAGDDGKLFTCAVTRKKGPRGGRTVCWPRESAGDGAAAHYGARLRGQEQPDDSEELRLWVLNDEGLYDQWQASGQGLEEYIAAHADEIRQVAQNVTSGRKPAHYLKYGPYESAMATRLVDRLLEE
jgi:hypothetical protein